jgi:L-alanine-DL-glutamate epimerase-like enolase superfamily enzyme
VKVTQLEVYVLRAPDTGRPHWVSHFIVPRVAPVVDCFRSGITELILGADPLAPERLYQKLFALTSQRLVFEKGWSREALVRICAAVDIAAWDIVGKVSGLPLYRLFGGYRSDVPCYVTCA